MPEMRALGETPLDWLIRKPGNKLYKVPPFRGVTQRKAYENP